jgi:hypothetical protein
MAVIAYHKLFIGIPEGWYKENCELLMFLLYGKSSAYPTIGTPIYDVTQSIIIDLVAKEKKPHTNPT